MSYWHYLLTLRLHHTRLKHGAILFAKKRDNVLMSVKWLSFDHKSDIGEIWVVYHADDAFEQARLRLGLEVPLGARICVQLIHVLQVVLPVAAANDV